MNNKRGKNKWLVVLLVAAMVSTAFATPEEDTELAEKAYNAGDLPKTIALLGKAAVQGYAPAQVRLGEVLDYAEEDEEAVRWYRKAIEQGSAAGELGLGIMYLKGEGVAQDSEKALYWVGRAAGKNYLPAVEYLARGYRVGDFGSGVNIEQAEFWEAKAISLKSNIAAEKAKVKQGE